MAHSTPQSDFVPPKRLLSPRARRIANILCATWCIYHLIDVLAKLWISDFVFIPAPVNLVGWLVLDWICVAVLFLPWRGLRLWRWGALAILISTLLAFVVNILEPVYQSLMMLSWSWITFGWSIDKALWHGCGAASLVGGLFVYLDEHRQLLLEQPPPGSMEPGPAPTPVSVDTAQGFGPSRSLWDRAVKFGPPAGLVFVWWLEWGSETVQRGITWPSWNTVLDMFPTIAYGILFGWSVYRLVSRGHRGKGLAAVVALGLLTMTLLGVLEEFEANVSGPQQNMPPDLLSDYIPPSKYYWRFRNAINPWRGVGSGIQRVAEVDAGLSVVLFVFAFFTLFALKRWLQWVVIQPFELPKKARPDPEEIDVPPGWDNAPPS